MEKKTMLMLGCMLCTMLLATSCSSSDDDVQQAQTATGNNENETTPSDNEQPAAYDKIDLTDEELALVGAYNGFALRLMQEERLLQKGNTFVVSPMSIGIQLGMLANGAQNETQREILGALGFEKADTSVVNSYFNKIMTIAPAFDPDVNLGIANMMFANSFLGVEFDDAYAKRMQTVYQSGIGSIDFTQPSALTTINSWCNEHTYGMIPEILTAHDIKPTEIMVCMLNAVYFNAPWAGAFVPERTMEAVFTREDGQEERLYLMNRISGTGYYADNDWSAISLPYGKGDYRMMVILPGKEDCTTVSDIVERLTSERWDRLTSFVNELQDVDVFLPGFQATTEQDLIPLLMQLGIEKAFSTEKAEFMAMVKDNWPLYIDFMKHKARVVVTQDGTEAAAVTASGEIGTSTGKGHKLPVFRADRPFVYAIYEKNTKAIFFMGAFMGKE